MCTSPKQGDRSPPHPLLLTSWGGDVSSLCKTPIIVLFAELPTPIKIECYFHSVYCFIYYFRRGSVIDLISEGGTVIDLISEGGIVIDLISEEGTVIDLISEGVL